jgi:hypothetical protein
LERATIVFYRQHLAQHIVPHIGATKLSQLSAPMVRAFEDKLSETSSPAMVRKVRNSLSSILADAQERAGWWCTMWSATCEPGAAAARRGKPNAASAANRDEIAPLTSRGKLNDVHQRMRSRVSGGRMHT